MHVISKKTLANFWAIYPDSEQALKSWHRETSQSTWLTPADIKVKHPSASFLVGNRVVFNIKGNHYRLIVRINYDYRKVWIRFVGTHSDYDKINAQTI